MRIPIVSTNQANQSNLSIRCPNCKQIGVFGTISGFVDIGIQTTTVSRGFADFIASMRVCPNFICKTLVFTVHNFETGRLAAAYPPEKLDFDATDIPEPIAKAFEEAITCHANQAYIAAAIMVRKTLEELCHNQNARGSNLQKRLEDLGTKIVLPLGLMEAAHDLRLLGNDAAHVEARTYTQVSQEEVETGILLAKELLKAVFQYNTLLSRLKALKQPEDE